MGWKLPNYQILRYDKALKLLDKKTAQALFTTLVFVLVLMFAYAAWRVLIAFLFAIFFAYLVEAPVGRLQRLLRGSRTAAITVVYLIFIAGLVLVMARAAPPVIQEAQTLLQKSPQLAEQISGGQITRQVATQHGWSEETQARIQSFLMNHRGEIVSFIQNLVFRAARTLQGMWWLFLVPILAIFFLKDGRKFGDIIINSVEDINNRQIVSATVEQMNSMLGDFLRAQLLLAALAMVVITIVLSVSRVPYAVAIGPAAGALEFIPVIGPFLGIVLVLGIAFLTGYNHLFWILVFLLVWRGLQDYVNSPRILGDKLKLHPLAVLFGVLAGGEVAGVIGVFLSIPVLATLRILWHTWQLYRRSPTKQLEFTHTDVLR
ncbi:MAG TPA: AI-2E family transporter [Candidatus Angelobacter sp.]|nr:AI-2E family transporter [Candidatus Angelobacter sp.]